MEINTVAEVEAYIAMRRVLAAFSEQMAAFQVRIAEQSEALKVLEIREKETP